MATNVKSPEFLRIDINDGQVRKAISICQKDTLMRTLIISLVDSGSAMDLSEVLFAEILIKKADGYEVDNGCVIDGNTVCYTLKSNDVAALGRNVAQIMLTKNDGQVLTTPPFELNVYSKILDQKVQVSQNDYSGITAQLVLAKAQAEKAADAASNCDRDKETIVRLTEENRQYFESVEAFAEETKANADNAKVSEDNASSSAIVAAEAYGATLEKVAEAETYVTEVNEKASAILSAEYHAQEYAESALASKEAAKESETIASEAMKEAAISASLASESEDNAAESESNAQYYAEQVKTISESLSGALRPIGTVLFSELPSLDEANPGDMYNVSNEFITTSDFKEGAGSTIAAGSNVYVTIDKKWDVLSGTPVTGIKGNAEKIFHRGNVNITAENIGLALVASTGSYKDLDNTPSEATTEESGLMSATDKEILDTLVSTVAILAGKIELLEGELAKLGYPIGS